MKYLWYVIIFSTVFLLLINIIKLIGISLNYYIFFRLGKTYMVTKPIHCNNYEIVLSLVKKSGMKYALSHKSKGIILLRERFNVFSLNIFIKLRSIIYYNFNNNECIIKILYDKYFLYYFYFFISIIIFPITIIIFGQYLGLIIYIICFIIYSILISRILKKILFSYQKLIEMTFAILKVK